MKAVNAHNRATGIARGVPSGIKARAKVHALDPKKETELKIFTEAVLETQEKRSEAKPARSRENSEMRNGSEERNPLVSVGM